MGDKGRRRNSLMLLLLLLSLSLPPISLAYRPGDIVPMSKMGQYHSSRTTWHDVIGKHCPIFAVNREVLIPLAKPMGYTGADPYKISFQIGREKFLIPWLLVVNRKSSEVPMIDVHLGVCISPFILLLKEEQSDIDVTAGFYVLFGSGLMLSFILSIYILQSSRDKFARFVRETVVESSSPSEGVAKVE
ncbi:uncharacterized protein LOC110811616 [Carica papaya]|uniref:uncharacterized protein LOC110811616 n=1 Tax=Carica papaya TaxID=3649 RepID=UPI000B8D1121|nr:uncharacterized protein LOC110811616 [Carica papaya]